MSEKTTRIARQVLALSKTGETEVIVTGGRTALTRFAGNTIHQNVAGDNVSVTVRIALGKKIGSASSNDVSKTGLKRLVETAREIAENQSEIPDFPGLAEPQPAAMVEAYSRETAAMTPAARAAVAASIIKPAEASDAVASGAVSDGDTSLAVMNSRGVHASERSTDFKVSAVVAKGAGAGYAFGTGWSSRRVDGAKVGETALEKCLASRDPRPVEPGEYTVILEPAAVAQLMSFTAYMGFGAQAFLEGRGFTAGRLGERIMHESVSLWDDGLDADGAATAFDMEGVPKRRVSLIDAGVAAGVVYDTYHAAKGGAVSTGHSLGPGFAGGPLPTNLFMAAGSSSIDEMTQSTERGIVVTRFHYVNIADPQSAVLTGLTRNGTFG
jgi:predicted Zn-dependent protease